MILIWFIFIKLLYLYKYMKSIIGDTIKYDWKKLKDLQPDGLKVDINFNELKESLKKNDFAFAFQGWQDEKGNVWIVDGHTRKQALYELQNEGEPIPELLEVTLINVETKKQAQEILLNVFNQKHNPMNEEILIGYIEQYNLDVDIVPLNVFVEKVEDVEHEKNVRELTNMIAIELTDEEQEIWLNAKNKLKIKKDKNAIFELIKLYFNEKNT